MDINCEFSNPRIFDNSPPQTKQDFWQFSKMDCSIPDFSTSSIPSYISKITSTSSPEKTFYLSNTIDTGQLLMLSFGIIFFVFGVVFLIFSIKNTISKKV
jgi:hypothetical protein